MSAATFIDIREQAIFTGEDLDKRYNLTKGIFGEKRQYLNLTGRDIKIQSHDGITKRIDAVNAESTMPAELHGHFSILTYYEMAVVEARTHLSGFDTNKYNKNTHYRNFINSIRAAIDEKEDTDISLIRFCLASVVKDEVLFKTSSAQGVLQRTHVQSTYVRSLDLLITDGEAYITHDRVFDVIPDVDTWTNTLTEEYMNHDTRLVIVDNDRNIGDRYINMLGKVIRITPIEDPSKESGVYVRHTTLSVNPDTRDILRDSSGVPQFEVGEEFYNFEEADLTLGLKKTVEEARTFLDSSERHKQRLYELELEKEELKKHHEIEMGELKLELERYKNKQSRKSNRRDMKKDKKKHKYDIEDRKERNRGNSWTSGTKVVTAIVGLATMVGTLTWKAATAALAYAPALFFI